MPERRELVEKNIVIAQHPMRCYSLRGEKVSAAELDAIDELYNREFPLSNWSRTYLRKYLHEARRYPIVTLVAYNNKLIGLAIGRLDRILVTQFNIAGVAISKSFKNMGLKAYILKQFIAAIWKTTPATKIVMHYRESKDPLTFYERFGFGNNQVVGKYSNEEVKYSLELNKI